MNVNIDKEQIKKLIDKSKRKYVYYEKLWNYPKTGDDQRTCPMLDMMFNIERKGGHVIFIPDIQPGENNARAMNKEDIKTKKKEVEK